MPPGYGPPPYYPPPGFRFETMTEKGLKFINYGLWFYGFVILMTLILIALLASSSYSYSYGGFYLFGSGIIAIFGLVTLILWLLGFANIYQGKFEYGPVHTHKVTMALIFIVLYIVTNIALVFFSITTLFYMTSEPGIEGYQSYSTTLFLIRIVFGFVATLFISLAWVFLIVELASEDIKRLLWMAFGLSMLLSVGSTVVIIFISYNLANILTVGLGAIVFIMVMYCYWQTYNRVKNREIAPILPPFPPPLPPGYMPQYQQPPQRYP